MGVCMKSISTLFNGKAGYMRLLLSVLIFGAYLVSASSAQATSTANALHAICGVYSSVTTIIFILGLTLMILGGAIYAGAHVAPSSLKGSLQGYGMGFIVGGIIGVIIVIIAPYLLQVISGNTAIASACTTT